jgi:Na+/H+ antiporter NhaD/arsenite permease-like protein
VEIAAAAIFVVALGVIALEWVHRTKVALAAAALMVVVGILDEEHAIEAVDWSTLGLLTGMMILVGLTERTGIFTFVALKVAQLSKGRPFRLVLLLALTTGVLSAFLDNLTTVLLIVPVTMLLADVLRVPAIPLVLIEVLASNIGGTATLIGDPPNILIGTAVPELSFNDFIVNLAPVSILTLFVTAALLYFAFRKRLVVTAERAAEIAKLDAARDVREGRHVKRSIAVLLGTIVAFFLHNLLGVEPAVVALVGATILLVLSADDLDDAFRRVDWTTLFFFLGLFVMVGGLEEQGVLERVADFLADLTGGSEVAEAMAILWGAALGSALVDNIPFTTAMIPVVDQLNANDEIFRDTNWWALALGACFGGNATLIAAAANVAATGVLQRAGTPISFARFLAVGLPITLLSLVIATAYLLLFQL